MMVPMSMVEPAKRRRNSRRDAVLDAATQLFSERGFHGTTMEAIGAAAGMTGPGVYKHFANKHAVLAELYRDGLRKAIDAIPEAKRVTDDPYGQLEAAFAAVIDQAIDDHRKTAIFLEEDHNLAAADRASLGRLKRRLTEEWAELLLRVRPDLPACDARFIITSVGGLVTTGAGAEVRLSARRRRDLLLKLSLAALLGD